MTPVPARDDSVAADHDTTAYPDAQARRRQLFADRDLFVRGSRGARFVRLTGAAQARMLAAGVAVVALGGGAVWWTTSLRAEVAAERAVIAGREAAIGQMARKAAADQARAAALAADLSARQAHLEDVMRDRFGPVGDSPDDTAGPTAPPAAMPVKPGADAAATLRALDAIAARQERLASVMLDAATTRAATAERAIARLGLDPARAVRAAAAAGGPLTPYAGRMGRARPLGPALARLEPAVSGMAAAERALAALPTGRPADVTVMSSGFGYRSDPFTGTGAMHSGLDFPGPVGTPIRAAAPGRVVLAGTRSGYGTTIEIDHGHGLMTRYAHLSGVSVRPGATVAAGDAIGRMGSTGRSTGSHLHFEVRMNGVAVNPRRFLDAGRVLEAAR